VKACLKNTTKYFSPEQLKLIKDFTPARVDLASGIVIKQHVLERNRYFMFLFD
jgi:hypothetical protein